jgi:hypothetical protein
LSYFFLKLLGSDISEKLEIFYTVGLDTIGMILAFFGPLATAKNLSPYLINAGTSRTHHTSNLMLLTDGVQHRVLRELRRSHPPTRWVNSNQNCVT